MSSNMLDEALRYHRRGWCIIPIGAGMKKPPQGLRWKPYQTRPPTETRLTTWFGNGSKRALGVILGDVSAGLICRDFDTMESYRRWAREHPDLAETLPTVATARGRHVYFRADHRGIVHLGDGELRGAGLCLLPPSQHPDGPTYRWLIPLPDGELPYIDDVVAAGLLPKNVTQKTQKAQKAQEVSGSHRKSQVVEGRSGCFASNGKLPADLQPKIHEAVRRTIPPGPGQRRAKLFELARRLMAVPELAGIPATEIGFLKPYVRRWWKLAKPKTSGKHPTFEETWQDFVFAWEEARIPYGATMQAIFEKAKKAPPPTKAVERYGAGSLRTVLASLCRELQRFDGKGCFHLSGRTAGPLLGVSDVQAWRWLNTLEADRIIRVLKKYPRGTRLATEFRYVAD